MITTRESINYQFSLIFGYSSPNNENIKVGNIISPGTLTKGLVNELSVDVINYFSQYNAMLRDYTGSELYSIEYELINFTEKVDQLTIYPKSMIFIPANYKNCESLLLALKPETGYINLHKSNQAIKGTSQLFFEIEEYSNRPDLNFEEKFKLLKKFANRFSNKMFGQLIEDKWNRKLVGISESLPTEKKFLKTYAKFRSKLNITWDQYSKKIEIFKTKFEKIKNPYSGKTSGEHLKFSISEPSANFVIDKTIQLGINLLNLANIGTIDEFQEKIISFIITKIKEELAVINEVKSKEWLIGKVNDLILESKSKLNQYDDLYQKFLISGEKGDLEGLIAKFNEFVRSKVENSNEDFNEFLEITKNFLREFIIKKEIIRSIEFESSINYFIELVNRGFMIIENSLPKFLIRRDLMDFIQELTKDLLEEFDKEEAPVKLLARRFIHKFEEFMFKLLEKTPQNYYNNIQEDKKVLNLFKSQILENLNDFFNNLRLDIKDIVLFGEINLNDNELDIKPHIEKFKTFSEEIHFLLSYILRYSTINRFLKNTPDKEMSDPVSFATKFHRFLEKRLAGLDLKWKDYILTWMDDYAKLFFKLETHKDWTIYEIFNDFVNYLEERENKAHNIEDFLSFLDTYITTIRNEKEKITLIRFLEHYKYFIGIKTEFPKYVLNKIEKKMNMFNMSLNNKKPIDFLFDNRKNLFYNYIEDNNLKYYSKLVPIPTSLILKHKLSNEEKKLFKGDFFQVFNFRFWGKNHINYQLSDNFSEVYREWLQEL